MRIFVTDVLSRISNALFHQGFQEHFVNLSIKLPVDFRIFIAQIFTSVYLQHYFQKSEAFAKRDSNSNSFYWPTKRMKDKSSIWPEKKIQCYCKAIDD